VTSNFIGGAISSSLGRVLWRSGGWFSLTAGAAGLIGLALIVWLTQREQALALVPASNFLKRETCLRIIQQNVDLAFAESSQ